MSFILYQLQELIKPHMHILHISMHSENFVIEIKY